MPNEPKDATEPKPDKAQKPEPAVYTYVGGGSYLHGVPARDLTAADLERIKGLFTEPELDADGKPAEGGKAKDVTKKTLEQSGLYEKAGK